MPLFRSSRSRASEAPRQSEQDRPPHVAVMTMTRDEADMLPRWVKYYGDQVGTDNLVVLDDNSGDGSTSGLPCTVHHLPAPLKASWREVRNSLVNGMARALLSAYDVVIFTDVDEFLVPDPARYKGLMDFVSARSDKDIVAPVAVNVLHNPRLEPALDPAEPVLRQRTFVKFAPEMCKPLVKRVPAQWSPGFHGTSAPFEVDRDLLMVHLKYYDVSALQRAAEYRHTWHTTESRGSAHSAWSTPASELVSQLQSWVDTDDPNAVPEFDLHEPDVARILRQKGSGMRAVRRPKNAMEANPLRRLPERFRDAL